jgi:hypothetical protein
VSADTLLALMVALIFSSGLLFAAYLGIDALRSRARESRARGALSPVRGRSTLVRLALVVAALFVVAALAVVVTLIRG